MLNLGPIRYARVLSQHNGPIEKIGYSRIEVFGKSLYQAQATLSGGLHLDNRKNDVFGEADGAGTGNTGMVARHKAISEAIERWALYYLTQGDFHELYGLEEDATSTGMSAFPGLFAYQARAKARKEAMERYCLVGWWEGLLGTDDIPSEHDGVQVRQIDNPLGHSPVILTWRKSSGGFHVYGFSASTTISRAYWQAVIEMERSNTALSAFYLNNPGFTADDLATLSNPLERRILYYSLPEGHEEFLEKINRTPPAGRQSTPDPIVDEKVEGPWNRYATVWRVLYPMSSRDYLSSHMNTFYW